MALDRSPGLVAHRFYVLVLFFCFSYSYVRQTKGVIVTGQTRLRFGSLWFSLVHFGSILRLLT